MSVFVPLALFILSLRRSRPTGSSPLHKYSWVIRYAYLQWSVRARFCTCLVVTHLIRLIYNFGQYNMHHDNVSTSPSVRCWTHYISYSIFALKKESILCVLHFKQTKGIWHAPAVNFRCLPKFWLHRAFCAISLCKIAGVSARIWL